MVAKMQQQPQQQYQGIGGASASGVAQQSAAAGAAHLYSNPLSSGGNQMSKYMNVSAIQQHRAQAQKRMRSPTPPPPPSNAQPPPGPLPGIYSNYPPNKYQAASYASGGKSDYVTGGGGGPKTSATSSAGHVTYVSQSGSSFAAQATPSLYPGIFCGSAF